MFLGPQFVPTFSFARTAVQSLSQACSSITQPVRPNLVYYWARGEYEKAYAVYYKISRYSAFLVLMTAAFLSAFASDFLRLWIGPRFVTGNPLFRADIVLWILLCAHLPRMMHSISWQLVFAQNRQNALTVLICVEAVVNTVLALFLIQRYGTVGLATATLLPMFLSHVVALPLIMRRVAGVSLRRYATEGIGRPLAGAAVVAAAAFALRGRLPVHSWADLFLNAGILAALALLIGAVFIVQPEDKQRVVSIASSLRSRLRPQAAASERV
jgi:O-antigen/teichoic acid export membrane protein